MLSKRIEAQQQMLESKIGETEEKLTMKIEMNRAEFIGVRDDHELRLQGHQEKLNHLNEKVIDFEKEMRDMLEQTQKDLKDSLDQAKREKEAEAALEKIMKGLE